jgi:hypothetical protein
MESGILLLFWDSKEIDGHTCNNVECKILNDKQPQFIEGTQHFYTMIGNGNSIVGSSFEWIKSRVEQFLEKEVAARNSTPYTMLTLKEREK